MSNEIVVIRVWRDNTFCVWVIEIDSIENIRMISIDLQ